MATSDKAECRITEGRTIEILLEYFFDSIMLT